MACLGITNRNISADAKNVARVSQRDFDAYLGEPEPTLAGLMRWNCVEPNRWLRVEGQPISKAGKKLAAQIDFEDSTTEWYTPPEVFAALNVKFDTDAASPGRRVTPWIPAKRFITARQDALAMDWRDFGFVWMNSPFGHRHNIDDWIEKFVEHGDGVALVPDFTSTGWFHSLAREASSMMVLKPKIQYLSSVPHTGPGNSLGSTMFAIGERGVHALHNAERAGHGLVFDRAAVATVEVSSDNVVDMRRSTA